MNERQEKELEETNLKEYIVGLKQKLEEKAEADCVKTIIDLIKDYEGYRHLVILKETTLAEKQLEYDNQFCKTKKEYMDIRHMKSTEAKEHAKRDLSEKQIEIINLESQIKQIKIYISSTEYMLRLKYIQMQGEE